MGLHPDAVYASHADAPLATPASPMNSAIALYAWMKGVTPEDTCKLFTPRTFERIGYYDYWNIGRDLILESARTTDIPLDGFFDEWAQRNPFMFVPKHPRLFVLADIARCVAELAGIGVRLNRPERFLPDPFVEKGIWPVYPGIAERLGLVGEFAFKLKRRPTNKRDPVVVLMLQEFITQSFTAYQAFEPAQVKCDRFADARFRELDKAIDELKELSRPRGTGQSANPYRGLPKHQFWRAAMGGVARADVDPVITPAFTIDRSTKVATAGSCFAQHIARALQSSGFNYLVVEGGPAGLSDEDKHKLQYGTFSARYGNIYTARQLRQLIDRAYGKFEPIDSEWPRPDGRLLDPFRPSVEPDGFADAAALQADRARHLATVRQMFETLDLFVFTLGLTEAWESVADGAVFPMAPGAVTPLADMSRYRFVNYDVEAVVDDLEYTLRVLNERNPGARVLLTVSPVPLVATYESRHVLVSTTLSKSVLRVAAEKVVSRNGRVAYFPSFEIVTGNHARGAYFEDDLRSVAPIAVDHVMRLFLAHYGQDQQNAITRPISEAARQQRSPDPAPSPAARSDALLAEYRASAAIICDEELLDA